ncbi:hypothetical protein EVAR_22446_1 [Eumeta japonica]|uniref:Uncharacterized protein n=1 Tax=Eumeta variegata TaxID=151549 RepID=A0A4C1VEC6_EUMVA|nr:hypothetical protein EVAR_22446_1 [Eumeta japonica]
MNFDDCFSSMPRVQPSSPEDFRHVLREKALNHSLFYLKLGAGIVDDRTTPPVPAPASTLVSALAHVGPSATRRDARSAGVPAPPTARISPRRQPRVSELARRFEPAPITPMQYLRPPRPASPADDITSSDEEDRAAVRRRSRDLSDDSAVELEPTDSGRVHAARRHSHPRTNSPQPFEPTLAPRREQTLLEAHVVELGARRGSEGAARCVRTPSVVVSDYSDGVCVGATPEEAAWLRARSLSADSACSSCSTLSSRDDVEEELEAVTPPPPQSSQKNAERHPEPDSNIAFPSDAVSVYRSLVFSSLLLLTLVGLGIRYLFTEWHAKREIVKCNETSCLVRDSVSVIV